MPRPPKTVAALLAGLFVVLAGGLVAAYGSFGMTDGNQRGDETDSPSTTADGVLPHPVGIVPGPEQAGWIKAENAKPGATDWHLTNSSRGGAIEGYANTVSAQRGDTVSLYVSTKAADYTVEAFRMGFYGGAGARLVWTSPPQPGMLQARLTVARGTNMVEARWTPSLMVAIDPSWPPGDYLFKLIADSGFQAYIPLTVRDDTSNAALLINNSVTTWQAYNMWGGYDLYNGRSGRSAVVSFDRPYTIGDGSGDFLGNEFPLVSLVESLGLDVSYTTDVDLHLHPEVLLQHHALISLGHDEYWSTSMREGVEAARDRGVNVAFLGANAVYRHIRLDPSPLGPARHEINYRSARADPMTGVHNAEVTVNWREAPVRRPENTLTGQMYQCNPVHADFVVTEPSAWIYAGANLGARTRIPGLIGSEYDGYVPGMPGPSNVEIMAHSPLRCRNNPGYSDLTYYTSPSGAAVIDTGTNNWVPLLTDPAAQPALVQITENILSAFAAGPAGLAHPSTSNYKTLPRGSFPPLNATVPAEHAPVTRTPTSTPRSTSTSGPKTSSTSTASVGSTTVPTPTSTPPSTTPPTTTP